MISINNNLTVTKKESIDKNIKNSAKNSVTNKKAQKKNKGTQVMNN